MQTTPGVVYTPADLADRLARAVLDPMIALRGDRIRVVDPACGEGALLAAAGRRLAAHGISPLGRLFGVEIEPAAAAVARRVADVTVGDGLTAEMAGFDAVLMNPPWVDAETHARQDPAGRSAIARKFACARGNWDLFVPFVERAWGLTRPGGRTGVLLPDRALSSDYMAATHKGWLRRRPLACWRLGRAFPTVSVDAMAWIDEDCAAAETMDFDGREVSMAALSRLPPGHWGGVGTLGDGELRRLGGTTLGDLAAVSDGASTAEAYRLAALVGEVSGEGWFRLVNTGTIDPFRLQWGERPTKYLGSKWLRPGVRSGDLDGFPLRSRQARAEKVVVAGLARRIEAAVAGSDVLCGKSAVCVVPREHAHGIAAVLNSAPIGSLYRKMFGAHGFGGSLHVGPRQLERLPMPDPGGSLDDLGRRLHADPSDAAALGALNLAMEAWLSD